MKAVQIGMLASFLVVVACVNAWAAGQASVSEYLPPALTKQITSSVNSIASQGVKQETSEQVSRALERTQSVGLDVDLTADVLTVARQVFRGVSPFQEILAGVVPGRYVPELDTGYVQNVYARWESACRFKDGGGLAMDPDCPWRKEMAMHARAGLPDPKVAAAQGFCGYPTNDALVADAQHSIYLSAVLQDALQDAVARGLTDRGQARQFLTDWLTQRRTAIVRTDYKPSDRSYLTDLKSLDAGEICFAGRVDSFRIGNCVLDASNSPVQVQCGGRSYLSARSLGGSSGKLASGSSVRESLNRLSSVSQLRDFTTSVQHATQTLEIQGQGPLAEALQQSAVEFAKNLKPGDRGDVVLKTAKRLNIQ